MAFYLQQNPAVRKVLWEMVKPRIQEVVKCQLRTIHRATPAASEQHEYGFWVILSYFQKASWLIQEQWIGNVLKDVFSVKQKTRVHFFFSPDNPRRTTNLPFNRQIDSSAYRWIIFAVLHMVSIFLPLLQFGVSSSHLRCRCRTLLSLYYRWSLLPHVSSHRGAIWSEQENIEKKNDMSGETLGNYILIQ